MYFVFFTFSFSFGVFPSDWIFNLKQPFWRNTLLNWMVSLSLKILQKLNLQTFITIMWLRCCQRQRIHSWQSLVLLVTIIMIMRTILTAMIKVPIRPMKLSTKMHLLRLKNNKKTKSNHHVKNYNNIQVVRRLVTLLFVSVLFGVAVGLCLSFFFLAWTPFFGG